jgi:hypothetical protein
VLDIIYVMWCQPFSLADCIFYTTSAVRNCVSENCENQQQQQQLKKLSFPISLPLSPPSTRTHSLTHTRLAWSSIWWRRRRWLEWEREREREITDTYLGEFILCVISHLSYTRLQYLPRHIFSAQRLFDADNSLVVVHTHILYSRNSSIIVSRYQRWLKLYQRDDDVRNEG